MRREETPTNPILIELDNISRSYGHGEATTYALKHFSLEVRRGEFIMIMGPSGCGKTTLLNVIGLLDRPTAGRYILNGKSVASLSSRRKAHLRSRQIGYIFQNFNLISNLPVIENVALPLIYSGVGKTRRLRKASQLLETFHLEQREYYYPHQLSGGQQQRVCIARSLVNNPEIILADEPTGNLDSRSSHIVMEELRNIHSAGNTIIMVTHNPQLTTYATRVIHMLDGQIDVDIKTVADDDLPQVTDYDDSNSFDEAPLPTPKVKLPDNRSDDEIIDEDYSLDNYKDDEFPDSDIPETKPEPKPEVEPEAKSEAPAKSEPTPKSEPKAKSKPESEPAPKASPKSEPKQPAKAKTKPAPIRTLPNSAARPAAPLPLTTHKPAPLGEISDEPVRSRLSSRSSFPIVGSEYLDKSVRISSKPSMEDLVILPSKSLNRTTRPRVAKSKKPSKKGSR